MERVLLALQHKSHTATSTILNAELLLRESTAPPRLVAEAAAGADARS
jgi:hypothetical protein